LWEQEDGVLFVGDDWAEDHHDVEVQDEAGRRLGKAKLAEGVAGIARLHELLAEHLDANAQAEQVGVGIETDRDSWVQALLAAGYQVWAINPLQVARYRERRSVSGAKSDAADAHTLADMVRTDRHPDAEIYRSQPGLGQILAARVLAEFGDDPSRYADARSRRR
jgi:transposase